MSRHCVFRFYEELNDFLPSHRRKRDLRYEFSGSPAVKDAIEAIGVPHPEVDLVLINGKSVRFSARLEDGVRVSVYPVFETLDISPVTRLSGRPLRSPRFVADVHLGKLARLLRLAGFDCLYRNDYEDREIIDCSVKERRTVLTRDRGLLKNREVLRGYWLRSTQPRRQFEEVLRRFELFGSMKPFSRCLECNGRVRRTAKRRVEGRLLPGTKKYYREFYSCGACRKVYWKGSHYERMLDFIGRFGQRESEGERAK